MDHSVWVVQREGGDFVQIEVPRPELAEGSAESFRLSIELPHVENFPYSFGLCKL
jgi:hypothetical protein